MEGWKFHIVRMDKFLLRGSRSFLRRRVEGRFDLDHEAFEQALPKAKGRGLRRALSMTFVL
jgi:hypothetical protein